MRKYYQHSIKNTINIHKIITIDFFERNEGFKSFLESHNFWEFAYLKKGEISFSLQEDKVITLKAGEYFFLPPNCKHQIIANQKSSMFILCFKCVTPIINSLSFFQSQATEGDNFYISSIMQEAIMTFDIKNFDKLSALENSILGGEQCIQSLLTIFIINVLRQQTNSNMPNLFIKRDNQNNTICAQILQLLEDNIYANLSIDDICCQINYSRSYISHLFKNEYGKSIITCFNQLKVEKAKQLLLQDKLTVAQISEKLHFSDLSYFNNLFKKHTGLSPTAYKNSIFQSPDN